MKPTEDLFLLIKSLVQTEKRYFKIYASKHVIGSSQNNYVKLFDIIDKQKVYDEEKVKEQYYKIKKVSQLPSEKNYLYKMIIDSLHSYHAEASIESSIRKQLHIVEILYKKALYTQAEKVLVKVLSDAERYERYNQLIDIIHWKLLILKASNEPGKIKQGIESIYKHLFETIDKMVEVYTGAHLADEVFVLTTTQGEARSGKEAEKFLAILKHPYLNKKDKYLTEEGLKLKLYVESICAMVTADFEKYFQASKKLIDLYNAKQHIINENVSKYISIFFNLLNACILTQKYDVFETYIKQYKGIPDDIKGANVPRYRMMILLRAYKLELGYYSEKGDFEKALNLVPEVSDFLEKHKSALSDLDTILVYSYIFQTYFGLGKYEEAVEWLNKVINTTNPLVREDIYCFTKILNLVTHYELDNLQLLDYTIKSTYQYLYRKKRLYKLEIILLRFIREYCDPAKLNKLSEGFIKLRKDLIEIKDEPYEAQALRFFDFISWLDSKIQKRSFAEVVKEKWHKSLKNKKAK